jgi:hypothetical protein
VDGQRLVYQFVDVPKDIVEIANESNSCYSKGESGTVGEDDPFSHPNCVSLELHGLVSGGSPMMGMRSNDHLRGSVSPIDEDLL